MIVSSEHSKLQNAVVDRIKKIPALAHAPNRNSKFLEQIIIPVSGWSSGSIEQRFKTAISKLGIAVIVKKGVFSYSNEFAQFPFQIEIVELSHFNRGTLGSKITADTLMELIADAVRNWKPNGIYSSARNIAVAEKTGEKELSISVQFSFQIYAPHKNN